MLVYFSFLILRASAERSLKFELDALTHRRTTLDPAKLAFLNKHHLMRMRTTESGLHAQALRALGHIKDAFPDTSAPISRSRFFPLFYIMCPFFLVARSPQWSTLRRPFSFFKAAW
jgi:hypothetical protein